MVAGKMHFIVDGPRCGQVATAAAQQAWIRTAKLVARRGTVIEGLVFEL